MARSVRASRLETRTARLKLPVHKKPIWLRIGDGLSLGYRRNQGPGTWVLRVADGKGSHWTKAIGTADDYADAGDRGVFDYWQAQSHARTVAGVASKADAATKLATVQEAVARYEAVLKRRGGDTANAARIRLHLPPALANKTVALLTARDFHVWAMALAKANLTAAATNRVNSCFKACLNLAADEDERVGNPRAWRKALRAIHDAAVARNVVLSEATVRAIIAAAYGISAEFGLLVELAAVTGARVSQLAGLEIGDVQADRTDPRLMLPSSRKGRGRKRVERRPVPIPNSLAARLVGNGNGRDTDAALLIKSSGDRWRRSDHTRLFARATAAAGISDDNVTIYALRHTNIVRQLLAGVPIRIVAINHDTSVGMIEKNYSRHIADHSDAVARRALLDVAEPAETAVAPRARL
jgi:integrase